jgi:diguanylate cyclase (GGDEF)-like protein
MSRQMGAAQNRSRSALELQDITRVLRQLEWLLVALMLLFYVFGEEGLENSEEILLAIGIFTIVMLLVNYAMPPRYRTRLVIAIETWLMIAFITWVLYFTAQPGNVVVALYLLPVILTALTLGKAVTLLQVFLTASCYLLIAQHGPVAFFSLQGVGRFAVDMAPIMTAAYITSMLSGEIVASVNRIHAASQTDHLTGAYNMRAFNSLAKHEFGQAVRQDRCLSVLMVDVDNLKPTNDNYGHAVGDRLIKAVAEAMQTMTKSTDVIARYGGDEFVGLLPGATEMTAHLAALRIKQKLASSPLQVEGAGAVPITVSMGIATYPDHGDTLKTVMENADRALYTSKARGRNRITPYRTISATEPVAEAAPSLRTG